MLNHLQASQQRVLLPIQTVFPFQPPRATPIGHQNVGKAIKKTISKKNANEHTII